MSSSTKFGFRPRALDVTKKLPIRIRKCRKRSPKIKRTVAVTSSGMEKEEEMESHLQQAILAQKATSAGNAVGNHVIPTPKVSYLTDDEYDRIYNEREYQKDEKRYQRTKKYIVFRDYVPFFLTQGSYNADSDDEQWLNTRRNINVEEFEHIIEKLEIFSHSDIIKPRNARALLQHYEPGLIDDVYDYWLQKRQKAASRKMRCTILMPRLCTEARKEDKSVVNPYVAFRRRLDKVQTRKKQKAELMTYEKMLQINFAMKRSIVLVNALAQREKLKRMACNIEYSIFELQYKTKMSNEEVEEISACIQSKQRKNITSLGGNSIEMEAGPSHTVDLAPIQEKRTLMDITGHPLLDQNFLQKNIEQWNSAALITPVHAIAANNDVSAEIEKIAAVNQNSIVDGRYQFKRRHGCRYRAPLPANDEALPLQTVFDELNPFQYFTTKFIQEKQQPNGNVVRQTGFIRRRIGRGGRLLTDLYFP